MKRLTIFLALAGLTFFALYYAGKPKPIPQMQQSTPQVAPPLAMLKPGVILTPDDIGHPMPASQIGAFLDKYERKTYKGSLTAFPVGPTPILLYQYKFIRVPTCELFENGEPARIKRWGVWNRTDVFTFYGKKGQKIDWTCSGWVPKEAK